MTTPQLEVHDARAAAAGGPVKRSYVQRIFSEIAPRYDLLNRLLSGGIDRSWRRAAIAALGRQPATRRDTISSSCRGARSTSGRPLSRASPAFGGFIVGADFAEPMLRAGLGKTSVAVLTPVVADALALPIRDASCDGAIVAFGVRNVVDIGAAFREVLRVLTPGARFVVLEFSTPRSRLVRWTYGFYSRRVLPLVGASRQLPPDRVPVSARQYRTVSFGGKAEEALHERSGQLHGGVGYEPHLRRGGNSTWE